MVEIKDKEGQARIVFSEFKKLYDDEPIFIDLLVDVKLNSAAAKEKITVELSDLKEFLNNLKRLNESLKQAFYLQHNDKQFQLRFEPTIIGTINVTGFLEDKQRTYSLQFSFEIPAFELNYIIRQTEIITSVFE